MRNTLIVAVSCLSLFACPNTTSPGSCGAKGCANGCCSSEGICLTPSESACGLNGAQCGACGEGQRCEGGQCVSAEPADAGACANLDPVLGSLKLEGARLKVRQSARLPAEVVAVGRGAKVGLVGLTANGDVVRLALSDSAVELKETLGSAFHPADRGAMGGFLSNAISVNQGSVAMAYTRQDQSGVVARFELGDGGVRYSEAPGVFTIAPLLNGYLVNGLGLGGLDAGGAGVYMLDEVGRPAARGPLVRFDAAWQPSSGFLATAGAVAWVGVFNGVTFTNQIRAVELAALRRALAANGSVALADAPVAADSDSLVDVTAVDTGAVLVHGAFSADYTSSWTTKVELVRGELSDGGVTVRAPEALLTSDDTCTRSLFSGADEEGFFLGLGFGMERRLVFFSLQAPQ